MAKIEDCVFLRPVPEGRSENSKAKLKNHQHACCDHLLPLRNEKYLILHRCFGRDVSGLVENFKCGEPAQSGEVAPQPGFQREDAAETDPEEHEAY